MKDDTPVYQNTTTSIDFQVNGQPFTGYDSSLSLPSTYFVLNHRSYIHAVQGGTYTFTSRTADDISLYWLGDTAYNGWTRANAALADVGGSPTSGQLITFTAELQEGHYYALRLVYANAQGLATENTEITAPDGTVILGSSSVANPYVIQYSCDGISAPKYPPFGQEK